jgi:hypothetical protein
MISFPAAGRVVLASLVLCACAAPARRFVAPEATPRVQDSATGFPDVSTDDAIRIEAIYPANPATVFGVDLTERGILPVYLRLGVADARLASARLRRDTFDPHVYLHNGLALGWLGPETMAERWDLQRAASEKGLPLAALPSGGQPLEGFVFFDLGEGIRVREHFAVTGAQGGRRELDLEKALVSLRVETDGGSREIRVGLRSEYFPRVSP